MVGMGVGAGQNEETRAESKVNHKKNKAEEALISMAGP